MLKLTGQAQYLIQNGCTWLHATCTIVIIQPSTNKIAIKPVNKCTVQDKRKSTRGKWTVYTIKKISETIVANHEAMCYTHLHGSISM